MQTFVSGRECEAEKNQEKNFHCGFRSRVVNNNKQLTKKIKNYLLLSCRKVYKQWNSRYCIMSVEIKKEDPLEYCDYLQEPNDGEDYSNEDSMEYGKEYFISVLCSIIFLYN